MQPEAAGKHLQGISDLTLVAPIRAGLIDALDTRTYASRLRLLLKTLQALRTASREQAMVRPFSDAVERVRAIHSFRLAILEPEQKLLLAVTFDRGWEPYIRIVWRELGALLDVIFCNCEGYVAACDHGFEAYAAWIRRSQVNTEFFYNALPLTVDDLHYLRQVERLHRDTADPEQADRQAVRLVVDDSEALAREAAQAHPIEALRQGLPALSALYRLADMYPPTHPDGRHLLRAAHVLLKELPGLLGRHGLSGSGLNRSPEAVAQQDVPQALLDQLRARFAAPLAWFGNGPPARAAGEPPGQPHGRAQAGPIPGACGPARVGPVQGGILNKHAGATHGCLVLLAVRDPGQAAGWLEALRRWVTPEDPQASGQARAADADADEDEASRARRARNVRTNVAFTYEGLRRLGVPDTVLGQFPREFREGMEARAGLLGDVQLNHPRNWSLPERNWPRSRGPDARVQLSMVHVVVQLLVGCDQPRGGDHEIAENPMHPLHQDVERLAQCPGMQVLSVQAMWTGPDAARSERGATSAVPKDRFGFADGISQPVVPGASQPDAAAGSDRRKHWRDDVPLGDLFLGHPSSRDDRPAEVDPFLRDGSFLVVRKLRQDAEAFERAVQEQVQQIRDRYKVDLSADDLKAKMMGRRPDGVPLVGEARRAGEAQPITEALRAGKAPQANDARQAGGSPQAGGAPRVDGEPPVDANDFVFPDATASLRSAGEAACPFQAHIRRANPRLARHGRPVPRIMRRGMSYGPRPGDAGKGEPGEDARAPGGVMFMAYNASIAEQFEVIQRWISGGNSSGVFSGDPDPILGLAEPGRPRVFRFEHAGQVLRATLQAPTASPFVQLEWGAYLFVPALPALETLQAYARGARTLEAGPCPALPSAERGERLVERLREAQRSLGAGAAGLWKAALEDISARFSGASADLWAAIRERHGGALRTPYGVLVASDALVRQVFEDPGGRYSVKGYDERLRESFGRIYLGLDAGEPYRRHSERINKAIEAITEQQAFRLAYRETWQALQKLVEGARQAGALAVRMAATAGPMAGTGELAFEVKEICDPVLAALCACWFGLPDDGANVVRGGWDWEVAAGSGPGEARQSESAPGEAEPGLSAPGKPRQTAPRCPGHFTAASRYTFQPNPADSVRGYARAHGQALRQAVGRFLRALPQRQGRPSAAQPNLPVPPILAAILDTYPVGAIGSAETDKANDDAASAIIGVMTGFVPTVDGNLRATLYEWLEDRSFWDLQDAYLTPDGQAPDVQPADMRPASTQPTDAQLDEAQLDEAHRRAGRTLRAALVRTMQLRPVPELVWRTAIAPHRLGEVDVLPEDRIVVSIVSATHEALAGGRPDVCAVFGGDRTRQPHATHACPGRQAAMGVLLGVIAALMACESLRPYPAPLTLGLSVPA